MNLADYIKVLYDMVVHPVFKEGHHPTFHRRQLRNDILAYFKEHPTDDEIINQSLQFLRSYMQSSYLYPLSRIYKKHQSERYPR